MQVTQLNLYPIKSTRAYQVNQAIVLPQGLNFDREFMLTESDGSFISARKDGELFRFSAFPIPMGIMICHDNGEQFMARYCDFPHSAKSEVWGSYFPSWIATDGINQWISQFFDRPVQLRWLGEKSQRNVKCFAGNPLNFADSSPLMLTNEQSLNQVQEWSPRPITMAQFRPNIVIDGTTPFIEEQWQQIQINEVKFTVMEHCTRCILITRDPITHQLTSNAEPFRALKKYHTNQTGKPIFGIHLVPQNSGVIRVGDNITIV